MRFSYFTVFNHFRIKRKKMPWFFFFPSGALHYKTGRFCRCAFTFKYVNSFTLVGFKLELLARPANVGGNAAKLREASEGFCAGITALYVCMKPPSQEAGT